MPGISRHVPGGTLEQIGIFAEQTQRVVATHAQESADFTASVIVINVQRDPGCRRVPTQCADPVLCLEDRVVLLDREAELVAQMNLAKLLQTLVAILFGPGLHALWVRLLPRPHTHDLPLRIQPASPDPNCVRARFALRTMPIASTAVPVELSESLHLSALLAAFTADIVRRGCDSYVQNLTRSAHSGNGQTVYSPPFWT
jgi:hypothetical protein